MMDFNQANWAMITNGYLSSIKMTLSAPSKFDIIIKAAKSFVKATTRTGDTTAFNDTSAEQDERAFLCDDESDLDYVQNWDHCPSTLSRNFFFPFHYHVSPFFDGSSSIPLACSSSCHFRFLGPLVRLCCLLESPTPIFPTIVCHRDASSSTTSQYIIYPFRQYYQCAVYSSRNCTIDQIVFAPPVGPLFNVTVLKLDLFSACQCLNCALCLNTVAAKHSKPVL